MTTIHNTTFHAGVERANRLQALEEVLGFTNAVLEVAVVEEEKRYILTSSGIIVVKNLHRDIVITAFMATVSQGYRLYRMAGKGQMSPRMEKRISKNCKRHPELFTIRG